MYAKYAVASGAVMMLVKMAGDFRQSAFCVAFHAAAYEKRAPIHIRMEKKKTTTVCDSLPPVICPHQGVIIKTISEMMNPMMSNAIPLRERRALAHPCVTYQASRKRVIVPRST